MTVGAMIAAAAAITSAAGDSGMSGMPSGMSGMPDGISVNGADAGAGAGAAGTLVMVMVIGLLLLLISVVMTCMFVCCDSAKSRKLYAIALVLGGLGQLAGAPAITVGGVLYLVLTVYWGYEMMKLAKIAEEGNDAFTKM